MLKSKNSNAVRPINVLTRGLSLLFAGLVIAILSGCASQSQHTGQWPTNLYINPQVSLPERFSFIGSAANGSNTMVVSDGFASRIVATSTPPEQPRLQMLYDHNRKPIVAALLARVQTELNVSKYYRVASTPEEADGELRLKITEVGIAPASAEDNVVPYFRVSVDLLNKAGQSIWQDAFSMASSENVEREKASLLGDINGLKNFFDDGMPSVAQRLAKQLKDHVSAE
jgi:hypothetical protein